MNIQLIKRLFAGISIVIIITTNLNSKDIFFDLGGVIIETSKLKALPKMGFKCIFHPGIQKDFFTFLCHIDKTHDEPEDAHATYKGEQLPPLFCKWQKGKLTCQQVCDYIIEQVDKNPEYFITKNSTGKTKKQLIKNSAMLILPENTAEINKVKKGTVKLIQDIKEEKDEKGNPAHRLGIISNYDWDTIQLLKKIFPEVFSCFQDDMIIISSKVGMIKPNKNIFNYVKKQCKLSDDPKNNIFIDDQIENVESSNKCNFTGIKHVNATKTRTELKKLGVFSKVK